MNLTDAALRQQAYEWCGKNQTTYSEWTVDALTKTFIALRDAARAEQRERQETLALQTARVVLRRLGSWSEVAAMEAVEQAKFLIRARDVSRE